MRGTNAVDTVDDAPQVDVEHVVPLGKRELPRVAPVDDAGVVHGDVERSELVNGGAPGALDGVGIADVNRNAVHRRPLLAAGASRAR